MNRRSLLKYITAGVATSAPLAVIQLPRFANRKRQYGRFDYQADPIVMDPIELWETHGGICLLNGVEIGSCCYANTLTGIVRTYDIFRDGKIATLTVKKFDEFSGTGPISADIVDISDHRAEGWWRRRIATTFHPGPKPAEWWRPEDFPSRDVSCPIDGVLCETLHGEVEIWGPEL